MNKFLGLVLVFTIVSIPAVELRNGSRAEQPEIDRIASIIDAMKKEYNDRYSISKEDFLAILSRAVGPMTDKEKEGMEKAAEMLAKAASAHVPVPLFLIESLFSLGRNCEHGCTGLSNDTFGGMVFESNPYLLDRYQVPFDEAKQKINFVYDLLEKHEVIKNGVVNEVDGSIIKSSIQVTDRHRAGIFAPGLTFVSPKKPSFFDKVCNVVGLFTGSTKLHIQK